MEILHRPMYVLLFMLPTVTLAWVVVKNQSSRLPVVYRFCQKSENRIENPFRNSLVGNFCDIRQPQRRNGNAIQATLCYLFLRPTNTEKSSLVKVSKKIFESVVGTDLPWTIELESSKFKSINNNDIHSSEQQSLSKKNLTIRLMELSDIDEIVSMNIQEYGSGPAYFPLTNPSLTEAWADRQYLRWLVDISCRIKVLNHKYNKNMASIQTNDHAILVGVLNVDQSEQGYIIGMIEISLQPLNPFRTPNPIPIPLTIKQAIAAITTGNELVGWITNLLIVPNHRGCGYAKILIAASEHVSKSFWNCTSIYLHCDADPDTGRIPQNLYSNLGYRTPILQYQHSLPSKATFTSNVVEVEGVPLLFLHKDLSSNP
jgi:Acetyltransferase (GNAT) family